MSVPVSGGGAVPGRAQDEEEGYMGGWVFGKGLAVFGFRRPTGATYLLGVVLMRCWLTESQAAWPAWW